MHCRGQSAISVHMKSSSGSGAVVGNMSVHSSGQSIAVVPRQIIRVMCMRQAKAGEPMFSYTPLDGGSITMKEYYERMMMLSAESQRRPLQGVGGTVRDVNNMLSKIKVPVLSERDAFVRALADDIRFLGYSLGDGDVEGAYYANALMCNTSVEASGMCNIRAYGHVFPNATFGFYLAVVSASTGSAFHDFAMRVGLLPFDNDDVGCVQRIVMLPWTSKVYSQPDNPDIDMQFISGQVLRAVNAYDLVSPLMHMRIGVYTQDTTTRQYAVGQDSRPVPLTADHVSTVISKSEDRLFIRGAAVNRHGANWC